LKVKPYAAESTAGVPDEKIGNCQVLFKKFIHALEEFRRGHSSLDLVGRVYQMDSCLPRFLHTSRGNHKHSQVPLNCWNARLAAVSTSFPE
jgi:hypothetical protein